GFLAKFWKSILPERGTRAHGLPVYRRVARSPRIPRHPSGTRPPAAGVASRTPRQPHRVSPLWDRLCPCEGKPPSVPPRLAHPGASCHAVAASAAFSVPRVPASSLRNECNLRRAVEG